MQNSSSLSICPHTSRNVQFSYIPWPGKQEQHRPGTYAHCVVWLYIHYTLYIWSWVTVSFNECFFLLTHVKQPSVLLISHSSTISFLLLPSITHHLHTHHIPPINSLPSWFEPWVSPRLQLCFSLFPPASSSPLTSFLISEESRMEDRVWTLYLVILTLGWAEAQSQSNFTR